MQSNETVVAVEFTLKDGSVRVFTEADHGTDFQTVAEEFATTNVDKITNKEVKTKEAAPIVPENVGTQPSAPKSQTIAPVTTKYTVVVDGVKIGDKEYSADSEVELDPTLPEVQSLLGTGAIAVSEAATV